MTFQQKRGKAGETAAADYLSRRGWTVLERNWHCRYGEIDLIAQKDGILAFVEVKTRKAGSEYDALEAVTSAKQRKILQSAMAYLMKTGLELQPRFDVAAVTAEQGDCFRIEYLENAFDGSAMDFDNTGI